MCRYISPFLYFMLILVICVAFVAIGGVRVGVFEPLAAFEMLRKSVIASLVLSLLASLSLWVSCREANSEAKYFFSGVILITLVYSGFWVHLYYQKADLPKINDITTDTENPPSYINIVFLRHADNNPLEYPTEWADIQKDYYPEVKPLISSRTKQEVFGTCVQLMRDNGWELVAQYPDAGVVEATARTSLFGFRDDVIIRVSDRDGFTKVDMRSSSREGKGDFGTNAQRIESFMAQLEQQLKPSPALGFLYQ